MSTPGSEAEMKLENMDDKEFGEVFKGLFRQRKPEPTPFDGQDLVDPRAMRDWLQKPCAKCGLPTVQQLAVASHRGNFRHGGHKIAFRPIGQVCQCGKDKPDDQKL
jgi:hypothetical protein